MEKNEEKKDVALEKFKNFKNTDCVVHITEAAERNGEYTIPYKIGYRVFDDEMMGGAREGDLIVVTGISGHGKTSFAQCISANLSKLRHPSLWFSYEVIIDNILAKFKAMGVDTEKLLIYTPKKMKSGNLQWIQEKIVEGVDKFGIKFIFIDHLDFLTPKKQTDDQRRIVINDICTELKDLAKELRLVIFLLAHVKKVQGRAVEMQDLSESGATYKIADFVFTIEREVEIETISGRKTEMYRNNNGTVRMLKNRIKGTHPVMYFQMIENDIVPIEKPQYNNQESEINVEVIDEEEDKKDINLFGDKT